MNVDGRIRELSAKHQNLEREIEVELKHPAHDDSRIAMLKKEKLRLKDAIAQLTSH